MAAEFDGIDPSILEQAKGELDKELGVDTSILNQAKASLDADLENTQGTADEARLKALEDNGPNLIPGLNLDILNNTARSVTNGISKAVFETKDLLVGEPDEDNKSAIRKQIEGTDRALRRRSAGYGMVSSISQFATGIVGAGKILKPIKAFSKSGTAVKEMTKGAVAGAVVIDPHEERLSNLMETYPALRNPITEYLAAKDGDSEIEGRFKNALEGILVDATIVTTLTGAVKSLKFMRKGDTKSAVKVVEELDATTKGRADVATEVTVERLKTPAAKIVAPKDIKKVAEVDVKNIIDNSREDVGAILKHGSREDALRSGYTFKASAKIPLSKIGGSDEITTLMTNTSSTLKATFDKAKGVNVLTDKRVREMIKHRADVFGEDPDVLIGMISKSAKGGNKMVADMEAGLTLSSKLFQDTWDVAYKIQNQLLDEWGGDAVKAQAELVDRLTGAASVYADSQAIVSTMGRGLRRMRKEFQITPKDLENFKTLDANKLVEVLYKTKGDPRKLKSITNPGFMKRVMEEAQFSLTNSLLWLYPTHVVNLTGNVYLAAARPTEKLLGSLVQGSKGHTVRREALQEYKYTVASLSDSWSMAVEAFKRGDSVLDPHSAEFFDPGKSVSGRDLDLASINNVSDFTSNLWKSINYRTAVGLPTRTLGAADEFFKTMRYRAYVQAKAGTEALEQGFKGQKFKDYIKTRLDDSFNEAGLAIDPRALKEAQITTYTQDLLPETLGKGIQNLRSNYQPTALVLPFIKTPVNVLRYGHKMTPGLNLLQKEYRQMLSGKAGVEAQAQAAGQMLLGGAFMGITASIALQGLVTGGGPSDLKLKKELMATGWKPYSFVQTSSDGSKTYIPIGRFDPVAMPFAITADLVDMMVLNPGAHETDTWREAAGASVVAIAKNFSEKTFMLNVNQLLRALTDPEQDLTKFVGNTAGAMIPGSSAIRGYANQDPYLRDARGLVQNAMKNFPVYSETLPPQRDAFGDPIMRRLGLTTTSKPDVVQEEHNRIIVESGEGLGKMAPTRNGVDMRELELEDGRGAFDKLQEYVGTVKLGGRDLKQNLERLIKSKRYDRLVDGESTVKGTKMYAISGVVSKYRQAAYKKLLRESKVLQDAMQNRILEVQSLYKAKSKKQSQAKELLDTLGVTQ